MVIAAAYMIAIVITAVGVIGAVYLMHLISRSPRARARFRRRAFALAAGLYGARRELGYRLRRIAGSTARTRVVARRQADHIPVESAGR
jgi:hypothetical protein